MLTELECKTLDSLYSDKAAWFELLWILSDRVQEDEGEVAAEGVRVLCRSEQRPQWGESDPLWTRGWGSDTVAWYGLPQHADGKNRIRCATEVGITGAAPEELDLWGFTRFPTPSAAVQEFLKRWCGLDQETRERISKEWVLERKVSV